MNIDEVIANITRTIEGKKRFSSILSSKQKETAVDEIVRVSMIPMIDLNVKELEAILADLIKVKNS